MIRGTRPDNPLTALEGSSIDRTEWRPDRILFVLCDKDLADRWLKLSVMDRSIKQRLSHLIAHINRGTWDPETARVEFDSRGHRVNGMHTLLAISKTGISQVVGVRTGRRLARYIDSNTPRSIPDLLPYCPELAQSLVGLTKSAVKTVTSLINFQSGRAMPLDDVTTSIDRHPEFVWVACRFPAKMRGVSSAPVLLALSEYSLRNKVLAEVFGMHLFAGPSQGAPSQPLKLRDWLLTTNRSQGKSVGGLEVYGKSVYAMDCHYRGQEFRALLCARQGWSDQ